MPLAEFLTKAKDKFVDTMDSVDRFAQGADARVRRLKQAMFPEEPKPANAPPLETTPKAWEKGDRRGMPAALETETQKAKRSRR